MEKIHFEAPVFTAEAAIQAARAGVDRLELCSSYAEGGETPGAGMLSWLKRKVAIPVFVMIRPRGGDFVYTPDEFEVMAEEIRHLDAAGADGFVFGALLPDGTVNTEACRDLVQAAAGKPCTFHRAFDLSRNPDESLEAIIGCGFRRILTSGMKNSAGEGLRLIIRMLELAGDRIIVMPGGGLKPEHVRTLKKTGLLKEIHASCKKIRESEVNFKNSRVQLHSNDGGAGGVLSFCDEVYHRFRQVLDTDESGRNSTKSQNHRT